MFYLGVRLLPKYNFLQKYKSKTQHTCQPSRVIALKHEKFPQAGCLGMSPLKPHVSPVRMHAILYLPDNSGGKLVHRYCW